MEENVLVTMALAFFPLQLLLLSPQQADRPIYRWGECKEPLNYLLLKGTVLPASSLNYLEPPCKAGYVQSHVPFMLAPWKVALF